jgi:hypothetical protein
VTTEDRLYALRWNERIRLVIGLFNRSAVAVLGAAAIGSAFGPGDGAPQPVVAGAADLLGAVSIPSVACAFVLHLLAHALVGLIEPED